MCTHTHVKPSGPYSRSVCSSSDRAGSTRLAPDAQRAQQLVQQRYAGTRGSSPAVLCRWRDSSAKGGRLLEAAAAEGREGACTAGSAAASTRDAGAKTGEGLASSGVHTATRRGGRLGTVTALAPTVLAGAACAAGAAGAAGVGGACVLLAAGVVAVLGVLAGSALTDTVSRDLRCGACCAGLSASAPAVTHRRQAALLRL